MAPQTRTGKPVKMFVYLPCCLMEQDEETGKKKPVCKRIVIKDMPFSRVEKGDTFIVKKRDNIRELVEDSKDEIKVKKVKRSLIDNSCIVVLNKIVFEKEEELSEFLKNKRSV